MTEELQGLLAGAGYVYHNPDTGEEYAPSHPIESGEVPDATRVRRSTEQEDHLYATYQAEWKRAETLLASLTARDAEIAALRAENDRLASAVVGGTLPGLLEDAEKTALVDFVKFLRSQPGHAARALHENPESKA